MKFFKSLFNFLDIAFFTPFIKVPLAIASSAILYTSYLSLNITNNVLELFGINHGLIDNVAEKSYNLIPKIWKDIFKDEVDKVKEIIADISDYSKKIEKGKKSGKIKSSSSQISGTHPTINIADNNSQTTSASPQTPSVSPQNPKIINKDLKQANQQTP